MSSAMNFLRRIGTEPQSAPGQLQHNPTFPQQTPVSATYAARTRDPNAPENKYQVTQKCIYERRLPGGSYITAHLQRLQSGYYDTPIIHEDLIDNVRFVGINFVFHPSRSSFRFKSAEIRVALHNIWTDDSNPLKNATNILTGQIPDDRRHSHATQTSAEDINGHVIKYGDRHAPAKVTRPKFLRFAPHLLYGGVSPETLDWNFNVAGSVGISQSGASASINPSGGMKGSYKVYEMMKIQGSMRTLRSWYNQQYDIEDGEIVWTLEENPLQKSGLPREFTFVMLLTKGSSNLEKADIGDLTLGIDIKPKVAGFLGKGSFPDFVTNLRQFQPYRYPHVDLDLEIGQIFEPSEKGRGFNFSRLSSQFDDYVFLPGTTSSKTDNFMVQTNQSQTRLQGQQSPPGSPSKKRQATQQGNSQRALPSIDPNTLNLRVFLENARGSPIPLGAPISYLHLRPPSRNPSPLPPTSVSGSQRSHKRTITITSQQPSQSQSRNVSSSSAAADRPRSQYDGQTQSRYSQPQRRQQSLRKTRSRSELNSEYNSSPVQERSSLSYDFRSSPIPEQGPTTHDAVITARNTSPSNHIQATPARYRAPVSEEGAISQPHPDSQTLPQHEFSQRRPISEAPILLTEPIQAPPMKANGPHPPPSGTEDTNEWRTPPETHAELQPSPQLIGSNPGLARSRPTSNIYLNPPSNLRTTEWDAASDHSIITHTKQPRTYHSHAAQADPIAVEDPSHRHSHDTSVALPSHRSNPTVERSSGAPPSRPFSYSPVREALNLAMLEQTSGLPPGATPSHGFGGAVGGARKAVLQTQPQLPSTSSVATGGVIGAGRTRTPPLSVRKSVVVDTDGNAIPATPPLTIHKRDISTSSSMGEATGVWNDSPPDWTSPAIAQSRGVGDVSRTYSQRMGAAGVMEKSNKSSPAGSVRRLGASGRTIRYSYPAAAVGEREREKEREGRYYRDRERRPVAGSGNGRGEVLSYGDEERETGAGEGGFAEGAV